MQNFTPWIAPGLSAFTLLLVWWLNRKTQVSDRLAEQSKDLGANVFQSAGELIDWLRQEMADLRKELDRVREAAEEEREDCHRAQESLRSELRVIREHCVRQGWALPEAPDGRTGTSA